MSRLFIFIILSWSIALLHSARAVQTYDPVIVDPLDMPWSWTEVEGLGEGKYLRCFDVGLDGTLWLGLHRGFASYDGERLRHYPELPSHDPLSVDVTSDGSVYLTYSDALWRRDGDTWFRYEHSLSIPPRCEMMGVREAPDGRVWIASESKLFLVGRDELKSFGSVADGSIADFDIDAEGRFWVLESSSGTVRSLRQDGTGFIEDSVWSDLLKLPSKRSGRAQYVSSDIFCDAQGSVWVANAHRAIPPKQLLRGTDEWKTHDLTAFGGTHLNGSISQTSDGIVRITGKGMIHRRSKAGWQLCDSPMSLRISRHAAYLKEAPDGSVWVLEKSVRISRIDYRGRKWRVFRELFYQDEASDGSRWYLGNENSVVRHEPESDSWVQYGKGDGLIDAPSSIFARSDGSVWVIGAHEGVAAASVWDGLRWSIRRFPELGMLLVGELHVEAIDGTLLLVGRRVAEYGPIVTEHFCALIPPAPDEAPRFFKIPSGRIFSANRLSDGRLALSGSGIFFLGEDRVERLLGTRRDSLGFDLIHDFEQRDNGELWVLNRSKGIARLKDGSWTYYGEEDGIEGKFVMDLRLLQNGEMAALTSKGLFRFDGREWYFLRIPGVERISEIARVSQSQDGAFWLNIADRSSRGSTERGVSGNRSFQTLRYMPDAFPPDTEVALLSTPDRYSRTRRVGWSGHDHGFERSTQSLTYSYRLDGGQWSRFTKEGSAYLEDLKPGMRRIEVRARDEDGNMDPTPATLEVEVFIPYWETGWFLATIVLVALAFAVLVYGVLLQRVRHVAALDRMRLRFLANISHELRTPLALIMGPLEVLASRNPRGSDLEKEASMALRNAGRLNELIDQLLELRKIEFEPGPGALEPCELVAFVRMLASDFDNLGRTAGQRVEFHCNVESQFLMLDKDAYRKILDNLVLNALKYSGKGSVTRIDVSISEGSRDNAKHVRMAVSDEGTGISKKALPHIFEAFYSGKASRLPGVRSFGVGLALVKEIVDTNAGTISVQSPIDLANGQRGGACFTVAFDDVPCSSNCPPELPTVEAPDEGSSGDPRNDSDRLLVLVAEDDDELRGFLSKQLGVDYEVIEARDGKDALDLAIKQIPDLIVSDISMPRMTGVELCEALRACEATSHIPIILQTAMKDEETALSGFESGAVDFIGKPFSIAMLKGKIGSLMQSRKQFAKRMKVLLLNDSGKEEEGPDGVFVKRLQGVLDARLSDPEFNAVALANELGLSQSSCYRKIMAMLDASPGEFIKNYRLEKSTGMLLNGATASQAAAAIAYSDARAYSRAFKKHFGYTPAGYKKAHSEG